MARAKLKKSESELLAEETLKMEAKLRVLKAEVTKQRLESEMPRTNSGSRWRAGAADIGSVTRYNKDVEDKIASKPLRPPPREGNATPPAPPLVARPQQRPGSSRRQLRPEDAKNWSVDDVKKWLTNLGMEAYVPQFVENAISGEILLEMGVEDLDYMKITALGHRKVLLKGIEQLKVAVHPPAAVEVPMSLRPPAGNLKPTAVSSGVSTDAGGMWMNPAGPALGAVDEVLHAISGVTLQESAAALGRGNAAGSLWEGEYDEEAERRAFQAAVAAWRSSGTTASNAASSSSTATAAAAVEYPEPVPEGRGGALLQGSVDEEEEHRAFQAAVAAWRSGGGEKQSCYQCYKVFVAAVATPRDGKSFCSPDCQSMHEAEFAERNRRREEVAKQLHQASEVSVPAPRLVESLEDKEPLAAEAFAAEDPVADSTPGYTPRDYSDIWAKNIEF